MASIVDSAFSAPIANPTAPDISGSVDKGITMGVSLAEAQQKMMIQRQDLEFRRQQLQQQKIEHMSGLWEKAMSTDDPALQAAQLDRISKVGSVLGMPYDQDSIDILKKSKTVQDTVLETLTAAKNTDDPAVRAHLLSYLHTAFSPGQSEKLLEAITDPSVKENLAHINATALMGKTQLAGQQAQVKEYIKAPGITAADRVGMLSGDPISIARGAAAYDKWQENLTADKHANSTSVIGHRENADDIAKKKLELTKQSLSLRGKMVGLGQQKFIEAQQAKLEAMNKKPQDQIDNLNVASNVLRPGMKWIDMNDAVASYTRAFTGINRTAFGSEQQKNFNSFEKVLDTFKGKIENHEDGGPSEQEIQLFKDRMDNLKDVLAKNIDNSSQKYWKSKVNTGLIPESLAQIHFETNKASDNSEWSPSGGRTGAPAIPNNSKPVLRNPNPGSAPAIDPAAERAKASAALQAIQSGQLKGVTADQVKSKFKSKTGQDF